ncbi:Rrg7p Ecym_1485 [Eremothecium cymbalariae DBVPG|uniref:Required for respiratory growth protein 7, mitochondrial n=1 Tax=Eremothecium cymbalariae (strain CBS 270.75 / DBVPG 7215 / KCTC 17166 / NRRL Y-17582) TaxID=931890 RepID=G8JMJ3_ERECY|nr:hypothetical protein Ecym_1485 [Eremothecium cymbalariae DBVPG\
MIRTTASRTPFCVAYRKSLTEYISDNVHICDSTVFQGTLYELTVMRELHDKLHIENLCQTGGAYDGGVDIRGKWDISNIYNRVKKLVDLDKKLPKRYSVNGLNLKPLRTKIIENNNSYRPLDIIVQCKAFTARKITGKQIRELMGAFSMISKNHEKRNNTIVMMSSPNLLTKDAVAVMNQMRIPLVYLQITMIKPSDAEPDFNVNQSGHLCHYFENEYASKLLDNCGINEWIKLEAYKL